MPELPEVEMSRQDLEAIFPETPILSIRIHRKDIWVSSCILPTGKWSGGTLSRHGKILVLSFVPRIGEKGAGEKPWFLLSRFGMSGSWRTEAVRGEKPAHTHLEIRFADRETRLLWVDPRRFGRLEWTHDLSLSKLLDTVGPDAASVVPARLEKAFRECSRSVRSALMDQRLIAGIGNIYAAEILFQAGINPFRRACDLSMREIEDLCRKMRSILEEAVLAGGSTIHSYTRGDGSKGGYQTQHLVYGREGRPCVQCGFPVQKIVQDARSLYYCSYCQGSM